MTQASAAAPSIASNGLDAGLRMVDTSLTRASLDVLAKAISKDETAACRIRSGERPAHLGEVVRMIYAAGLKVVDAKRICVDRATYEAMSHIAAKAMADKSISHALIWDEAQ